jgi:hypothetical protein
MGYYTQHLIRIIPESDATVANYKRIAEAIKNNVDDCYSCLRIHDSVMDDSNWNGGDGCKWYLDEGFVEISKDVPDLTIQFQYVGETYGFEPESAGGSMTLKDGKDLTADDEDVDIDSFYEFYGNIKESYILSDDPDEEVVRIPGGIQIEDLYKRSVDEFDDEDKE